MAYMNVWVEDPSLSKFDDEDLIQELENRGFKVALQLSGIDEIEHLLDCGFFREAATEALQLVERQLSRPNTLSASH